MLKRHEVEVLLKAGHPKTEVAGLKGVSLRSVHRLAEEAPVDHVDDAAERVKRGIGRPSIVEDFRKLVVEMLQEEPDLPSLEVLRRVREGGYPLHDEDLAAAILDRILERGRFIRLDGPSGRTRHLKLEDALLSGTENAGISGIRVPEFLEPLTLFGVTTPFGNS
jgi:hypothetical protein